MSFEIKTRAANGVMFVEFDGLDGKRTRASLGIKDAEHPRGAADPEARRKGDKVVQAKARDLYVQAIVPKPEAETAAPKAAKGFTLNQAIDYAERTVWRRDQVKSDMAYKSLLSDIRQLRRVFGEEAVPSIDTMRMQDYVDEARERGLGYGTIDKHFGRLSRVLNLCADTIKDPATGRFVIAYVPKMPQLGASVRRDLIVSPEDEKRILEACQELGREKRKAADYWTLARFLEWQVDTGMRLGETLGMTADWHDDGAVLIPAEIAKTGEPRAVVLMGRAPDIYKRLAEVDPAMFAATLSRNKIQDMWTQVRERCGMMEYHLHDLRHTAATRWRDLGVPLDTVARLLGHVDARMTYRVYDKVNVARLKRELGMDTNVIPLPLAAQRVA